MTECNGMDEWQEETNRRMANPTHLYYPIPLDNGRFVQVQAPLDLTKEEAEKVARVIVAVAIRNSEQGEPNGS